MSDALRRWQFFSHLTPDPSAVRQVGQTWTLKNWIDVPSEHSILTTAVRMVAMLYLCSIR